MNNIDKLEIIYLSTSEIIPYDKNPRKNDKAVPMVKASIEQFGFKVPIVVDENNVVVCGHTRLKAAKELGMDEVPCIMASDLTPEQIRAFRIADNKVSEMAEWDLAMLGKELADLPDFDFGDFGFDKNELEDLMDKGAEATVGETDPDAVPETPETPLSKPGEVYILGHHRLLCGDSTKAEDAARVCAGEQVDLLLTDPPYNVDYHGGNGDTIQNDSMDDSSFRQFLGAAFKGAESVMKPGASFYIFHADSEGYNFRGACRDSGLTVKQCLIWKKDSLVLGRQDFQWLHEPCLYGWKEGASHHWYNDRKQTTVMEFARPKKNDLHPTMKPVEMLVYLLGNSTKGNDLVFDPFGGSGSTLIACQQTGRVCRTIELDPKFCDVIRRRWAEFMNGEGCDWQALTPAEAAPQAAPAE